MMEKQMSKQALQQAKEALELCVRQLYHDGVPTDKAHPKRIAADAAENTLADLVTVSDAQPLEAGQALTIKEAFEHVGGYWTGEDKLCPTFGSGMALKAYTIKVQRNAVDISKAAAPAPAVPVEAQPAIDAITVAKTLIGLGYESGHMVSQEAADDMLKQFNDAVTATEAQQDNLRLVLQEVRGILRDTQVEYHTQGMGCGLENRGITDRYDAACYGWDEAMDQMYGEIIMQAIGVIDAQLASSPAVPVEAQPVAWMALGVPSMTDEEVWDIYTHATNKIIQVKARGGQMVNTGGRKFAIALTREIIRLSTPASVPSDQHPLAGMYINQGSMDAAADAYAAEYEAAKEERFMALKHRKRELETEVSDLRNTLRARERERDNALAQFTEYFVKNYPGPHTIIHDPRWHAPKIFRAAERAIRGQQSDDAKDAVRYRWLRDAVLTNRMATVAMWESNSCEELDAAIDAAMGPPIAAQPQTDIKDKRATCRHAFEDDIDCGGHPYERCNLCGQTR